MVFVQILTLKSWFLNVYKFKTIKMVFNHSIKVPTQYKKAAKALKKCTEEDVSVKNVIYNQRHADINKMYALISKICKNKHILDRVIEESEILKTESRFDPYLCRILVAELLFGAQKLNGESRPVVTVLKYEKKLKEIYFKAGNSNDLSSTKISDNPRYVRLNTLKFKRWEFLEQMTNEGWRLIENIESYSKYLEQIVSLEDDQFVEDFHVENLFTFPSNSKRYWATHSLNSSSCVLLQDKSSCLAPLLLNPPKKSVILDMCAAPGLKTTHLAAMIKNKGRVFAVEKHRNRFETMRQFVENTNSVSIHPIEADVLKLTNSDCPEVEYILLDPSCSGSGIVKRLDDIRPEETEDSKQDRLSRLSRLQLKMLGHAMTSFPKVKRIVYSTCSINPEENEEVVKKALKEHKDFKLKSPLEVLKNDWNNFGGKSFKKLGKKCVYCRPESDHTNGFFIALIERKNSDSMDVDNE